ncbi:MAG: SDR family NAD(P)-dependent oxidoreductase [Clostridiales bacterium]|nr:SDR family NAD(P)-dependent oxidoreductase [Clostridiales bacterium]
MVNGGCFDKIIAIVDKEEYDSMYIAKKYGIECALGGDTRNHSIKNALDYIKANYPDTARVLFHDSSRPFIKGETFASFMKMLDEYDGVAMTSDINDSLVTLDGSFVNRREFLLIQTPEAFKFDVIYSDFDENRPDTAIINQIKSKVKIKLAKSSAFNFKITYPQDLFLAEQLMRIDFLRTSAINGFDIDLKGKILLLGGSGGVGQAILKELQKYDVECYAPSHKELDLYSVKVEDFQKKCPFEPDIIINVAAAYENDEVPLLDSFYKIFDINLRSNLVIIEYAKTLNKPVNIVVMSSSSSTMGRENLTNYSAAKAALNSVVESQGHKLYEQNIYLNAIIPEKINTPLIEKLHKTQINTRELLDAEEVVNAVLKCATTKQYGKLIHIRKGL